MKRNSSGFPATMVFHNNSSCEPKVIVDFFAKFFGNVYKTSSSSTIDYHYISTIPSVFNCSCICFELNEIESALLKFKPKKTADILSFYSSTRTIQ